MPKEIELVPLEIKFMRDRINRKFSNGVFVYYVIDKIERGEMDVYDLPKIRVVSKDGFYYAFNNRRLYVYRVLHLRGKLDQVKVKLASLNCFQPERFTTKNNGESVRLQRGRTSPHSKAKSSLLNNFNDYDDQDEKDNHEEFTGGDDGVDILVDHGFSFFLLLLFCLIFIYFFLF